MKISRRKDIGRISRPLRMNKNYYCRGLSLTSYPRESMQPLTMPDKNLKHDIGSHLLSLRARTDLQLGEITRKGAYLGTGAVPTYHKCYFFFNDGMTTERKPEIRFIVVFFDSLFRRSSHV